jgi:hypothetical protein
VGVARQRTDQQFSIYISYLEIYNEAGYDLLDPSQDTKALEELPYVALSVLVQALPCGRGDPCLAVPCVCAAASRSWRTTSATCT